MKRLLRVIRDLLLVALILLLAGLIAVRLDAFNEQAIFGRPRVVDGDTLVMDGQRIRLSGIDAPELRQVCQRDGGNWPCGIAARDRLRALIGEAKTTCMTHGSDRYGRYLAVCSAGKTDLNAAMVSDGYAISFGDYQTQEDTARSSRNGLWAGTFDAPRNWRQTHGGMDEAPHMHGDWLSVARSQLDAVSRTFSSWFAHD